MDLGETIELGGTQPTGYIALYICLFRPVWLLTLLSIVMSLF